MRTAGGLRASIDYLDFRVMAIERRSRAGSGDPPAGARIVKAPIASWIPPDAVRRISARLPRAMRGWRRWGQDARAATDARLGRWSRAAA
jgi:hypothetical protein